LLEECRQRRPNGMMILLPDEPQSVVAVKPIGAKLPDWLRRAVFCAVVGLL